MECPVLWEGDAHPLWQVSFNVVGDAMILLVCLYQDDRCCGVFRLDSLREPVIRIGSRRNATIRDERLAPVHAVIRMHPGGATILSFTNSMSINGVRTPHARLHAGDHVQLGPVGLVMSVQESASPRRLTIRTKRRLAHALHVAFVNTLVVSICIHLAVLIASALNKQPAASVVESSVPGGSVQFLLQPPAPGDGMGLSFLETPTEAPWRDVQNQAERLHAQATLMHAAQEEPTPCPQSPPSNAPGPAELSADKIEESVDSESDSESEATKAVVQDKL